MRLGISSSLNKSNAKEWAEAQKALGCRSVVFPLNSSAPDELIDEYVREAKKNDLIIAEVGIWRNAISLDESERKTSLKYSIEQLKLADRIEANCCVNITGSTGKRWDGAYRENFSKETWNRSVEMIQRVIDEAEPVNTYFSIEPMPWMVPSSPEEYLKLIDDVNRERFGVHMDIINMINRPERYFFCEDFLDHTFELLGDKIKSCHLKDVLLLEDFTFQLKECACGEGCFNLEHYAELANRVNPDMPMILEHLAGDSDYVTSMEYVKNRLAGWL